jgi:two-component system chemotaxis sensor kinase CheA
MDMTQFYQIFFDESSELLAEMESLLLKIDMAAPNAEDLDAIFRVAHSIKGGASTFGFADMTGVTHVLESLLDRVRKRQLDLTSEMVDVLLRAGDVLKGQLAGHRGDGTGDEAAAENVCAALKRLAGGIPSPAPRTVPAATIALQDGVPAAAQSAAAPTCYQIEFALPETASAAALEHLRTNLSSFGKLELLAGPATGAVAGAYVWRLASVVPETDLWEAMAFSVDPAGLKIGAIAVAAEEPQRRATDQGCVVDPVVRAGRRETDKAAANDATSIRVSVDKVDELINLAGELVITQAMLAQVASQLDPVLHERLLHGLAHLDRNTRDLQESVMSIRMLPISFVFSRFPRVVRDLAGRLNKEVELKTVGETTELDKGLIEKIADPLNHLVRNSIDHGIEMPSARRAAGKPEKGTITLRAFHRGGNIVIEVADDGAGLSRERILARARSRAMSAPDTMSDQDVWQLIFEAGFSTAEKVTEVSGRGVGMDVVRRNIQALGGSVEIDSTLGAGTRMSIRLPLTLAILDGLSVRVGDQLFIIPLNQIVESLQPAACDVKSVRNRGTVVHVRGEYLPVLKAHEIFNIPRTVSETGTGIMVILESDGVKKALFVDELVGQHQVVIKSLETNYRRVAGISGATIMGDGKVAMIIDAAMLVRGVMPELRAAA